MDISPLCLGSFIFSGWEGELNPKPEFEPKCACYGSRNTRGHPPQQGQRRHGLLFVLQKGIHGTSLVVQ